MDIILGIQTKDEVLLITSEMLARGISVLKADDNKVVELNSHTAMAYTGEPGDTINFAELIKVNVQLYGFRNGNEQSSHAVAAYTRNFLASSLRSRKPFQVNVLIGGYDTKSEAPLLRWIDYLGTNVPLPYAAHGYASYYVLSLLDRYWKPDLSQQEGLELAQRCVSELRARMPIDFKGIRATVIGKDGISQQQLPNIAAPLGAVLAETGSPQVSQEA